jgi:hypothetical protein
VASERGIKRKDVLYDVRARTVHRIGRPRFAIDYCSLMVCASNQSFIPKKRPQRLGDLPMLVSLWPKRQYLCSPESFSPHR